MSLSAPPTADHTPLNSQLIVMEKGAYITSVELGLDFIAVAITTGSILLFDLNGVLRSEFPCMRATWVLSSWGNQVVSGDEIGALYVWDTTSKTCLNHWVGHRLAVRVVQMVSASTVISGSKDSHLSIWDTAGPVPICRKTFHSHAGEIRCMQVCGDIGVSGGRDGTVAVWNWKTYTELYVLRREQSLSSVSQVAFNGRHIAAGDFEGRIHLWDVAGRLQSILEGGHISSILNLHLERDVLVSSGQEGKIIVWSLAGFQQICSTAVMKSLSSFDENRIVTGCFNGVRLLEMTTMRVLRTFGAHTGTAHVVTVDRRRSRIISFIQRKADVFIEIWPLERE